LDEISIVLPIVGPSRAGELRAECTGSEHRSAVRSSTINTPLSCGPSQTPRTIRRAR
jgi:hypothetical protein